MKIRLLATAWAAAAFLFSQQVQIPVDTFPMAAKTTPDGKFLLVLNGGHNPPSISVIDIAAARELSRMPVPDAWLGLAMTKSGDKVYVGGGSRGAVFEFTVTGGVLKPARMFPAGEFIGDVQLAPDGHLLYAADLYKDSVVVINPQSGLVLSRIKTGRRPYRILFHPSGKSFYVSSWADGSIGQYDPNNGERIANTRVAPHTTDMAWSDGPVEDQPAITARLFVSAGNTNSVYVLGATEAGNLSRLESVNLASDSRQPLGTTPTGLGLSADGKKLFVACSDANAAAVVDISGGHARVQGFVRSGEYPTAAFGLPDGRLGVLNGHAQSVQLVDITDESKIAASSREQSEEPATPAGNPVRPDGPIKHVIYIVGYEGGADGQNRAVAAIAPDYTQRLWPSYSAGRRKIYDFEGQEPANAPPAGYLWTAAAQAGLSFRNYGFFVDSRKEPEADGTQITGVRDPILAPVTDPNYRGPDPGYPDVERAKEFIAELADFEKDNSMPRLLLMRMSDDRAVDMVVEAVSKSRFWPETAVFGVYLHRSGPLLASPLAKKGPVDSTTYDPMSVLRTVEIILGLHPLTTYDAGARPLFGMFNNSQ
jgi:YVTN family beta-propeller protein